MDETAYNPDPKAHPGLHAIALFEGAKGVLALAFAGGLLVQKLTREGGRSSGREAAFAHEDWTRAKALAETVEDHELLDPMLPPDRLLYRLFHEEQVRAFRPIPLEGYCSCSRARVEELLKRFSVEDLAEMVVDGEVWVTCEFCNSRYRFDPASFIKPDEAD